MRATPRERFLNGVRTPDSSSPVVSPFLPHPRVVRNALAHLGLPSTGDDVADEIALARELDYEPMFMTDCSGLIFDWQTDEAGATGDAVVKFIRTASGDWTYRTARTSVPWNDDAGCPVQTPEDHRMLVRVCEEIGSREEPIREYFRAWRRRVGEDGVIVIGHPHPSWLGYQINPTNIFWHWTDHREEFIRSMEAVAEASLFVMSIAMAEGIDFMSDSSYGLEMTSPKLFAEMDLPYIQRFSQWTHDRGGLFWYHNCGYTRRLILDGTFNALGADVIETIAPAPEGDNDLAESRRSLDRRVCSKGNFPLGLLRDGTPEEITMRAREMVAAVRGFPHILSTADAVLEGTPPENFIALVTELRRSSGS